MGQRRTDQQDDSYFRVMKLLQEQPDLTQRQVADQLGISLGRVNYLLRALMEKGWVKVQNFSQNPNKLGYAYLLTPTGLREKSQLASGFLKRKMHEYDALRAEIEALRRDALSLGQGSSREPSETST